MDTATQFHEQRLFFLTSRLEGDGLDRTDGLALRPALLARYHDLATLRYDYPLVLVTTGPQKGVVRSLSGIVDDLLLEVAPRGIEGEKLRRHVLSLEHSIRRIAASGGRATLLEAWADASTRVGTPDDPSIEAVLAAIGTKLDLDGDLVDCEPSAVARVLRHFWQAEQERKARAFREKAGRLMVRLADVLRVAFINSEAGHAPETLRSAFGNTHRGDFDFALLSKLVSRRAPKDALAPARRARIQWALATLAQQRFYLDPRLAGRPDAPAPYAFAFDNCAAAADAFRERLPKIAEVMKALAVAELEADNRYAGARDDAFFRDFDESALSADDIAIFPDYLLCIPPERNDAPENAGLMEMLSSGMPVKVLVEASDLYEEAAIGAGHFAFGVRSVRLANTATGLGGVYVVQTTSANLPALRERIKHGFAHRGAALFSVYAGAPLPAGDMPAYLTAAAALDSRAFPAFAYDPHAGDNQAARFTLADNPQAEHDWPKLAFEYADPEGQRVRETIAFTYVDFVLCDRRYAKHFARVPCECWNAGMIPVAEWLTGDRAALDGLVPYVTAVDADDVLHRVLVDQRLVNAAVRCRTLWHRLQEQGGIHNSHAERLLARERERVRADAAESIAPSALPVVAESVQPAPTQEPDAREPDVAWIETSRCPSCNECQLINDRMFLYNANKQAFIGDVTAGTYRQMVEAAESCQVAIIHPGKPWNPDEPGLPELIERARPFQ